MWSNEKLQQNYRQNYNKISFIISYHRKHRYELVTEPKKLCCGPFIDVKLAIKVIMDCRKISAHKFRKRLGFKQYDAILTSEQSVLQK